MRTHLTLLQREPVRVYLYLVLVAIVALLVSYGIVNDGDRDLWLALGAAVLAVPGIEAARARVTPTAKLPRDADPGLAYPTSNVQPMSDNPLADPFHDPQGYRDRPRGL